MRDTELVILDPYGKQKEEQHVRLTSLKIHGFKSFAEKTVINFNKNITGVVGPNGCGKSNVIDAIRWVLGEQRTKALRSDKMDNLIFNGTKTRKSSNRAEVILSFENNRNLLPSEFSTVTVARVLYRSGESEYRINDVSCRLKDITTLFMDTGISNDSYAIIELSMVNDILSDKDNVRRKLFEQASGISKYKKRKKETFNKLNATEADLERVEDLLTEIETNLKNLERQAKRAEKYIKAKENYKEASLSLSTNKLSHFKEQFEELKDKNENQAGSRQEIEAAILAFEEGIEKDKAEQNNQQEILSEHRLRLNNHVDKLRFEENSKGLLNEKVKYLFEKKTTLKNDIEENSLAIENNKRELENFNESLIAEDNALELLINDLNSAKDSNSEIKELYAEKKEQLQDYEEEYKKAEYNVFSIEKEIAIFKNQKENIVSEVGQSRQRFETKEAELTDLKNNHRIVVEQTDFMKAELIELIQRKENRDEDLNEAQSQLDVVRDQRIELNRDLDSKQNEYKLTKSLVENMDGYSNAVKFLKESDWGGDMPLLADIFDCQDEYKVTIENYLKPYLQNYISVDLEDAHQGIDLLKVSEKGKAGFLILNEYKPGKAKQAVGDFVPATDVIKVENKYKNLLSNLLDNVYVSTNGVDAFPYSEHPDAAVLSNTGDIIRKNGLIKGGSVGAFEGKSIGRVQNLEILEKDIEKLEAEKAILDEKFNKQTELVQELKSGNLAKEVQNKQAEFNKLQNKLTSFEARIQNYETFLSENESNFTAFNEKIKDIDLKVKELSESLEDALNKKEYQLDETENFRNTFLDIENEMSSSSESFNELNIKFHQQQNNVNSIKQNIQFKTNSINELESKISINGQLLESSEKEINEIEDNLKQSGDDISGMYQQKEILEAELANVEKVYFEIRGRIEKSEADLKKMMKDKENTDQILSSLKDRKNELDIQLLSIKERLSIEFGLEIEEVMNQEVDEEVDLEELELKVTKLKAKLERFGDVNPFAVEAYNEMKERFDFIQTQRGDLVSAKDTLLETINEIEGEATKMFLDAFNSVKENFATVFKQLFSADDFCDLILSDPDNPLESKVDIIAKPKGKKPLTINQLSGGEKSLTAISLIFGLYLLKPAPFCILDEVDAPLDDANVGKFNSIIKQFSENSQFIVVTHNKNTMAEVDIIYGVTNLETGISKVVPVEFASLN